MKRNHRNKAAIKQWLKTLDWSNTATIRNSHIMNHIQMNRYVSILMKEHKGIERVFWCLEKDKSQLESHAHLLVKTKGKIDSIPRKIHRQGLESLLKFSIGLIQTAKTGLLIIQQSIQASQISGTLLSRNGSSNKDFVCQAPTFISVGVFLSVLVVTICQDFNVVFVLSDKFSLTVKL